MTIYYQDDFVTLYHGDCLTDHREWLEADVLVTDPPYGMGYKSLSRSGERIGIAGDNSPELRDSAIEMWGEKPSLIFGMWRVPKPSNSKLTLTWDKGVSPSRGDLTLPWGMTTEEVYVAGEWPPIKPGGRAREGGTPAREASVIRCVTLNSQARDRPDHPTPKPVGLMERLIEKCPPGVVADPFAGSGSTLVAAKSLGRRVVGVELVEKYCEIIAKRCAQDVLDFGGRA